MGIIAAAPVATPEAEQNHYLKIGLFAYVIMGFGYGFSTFMMNLFGGGEGTVAGQIGLSGLYMGAYLGPLLAVVLGAYIGSQVTAPSVFSASIAAASVSLGFGAMVLVLLVFTAVTSPNETGPMSDFLTVVSPFFGMGLGVFFTGLVSGYLGSDIEF